MDIVVANNADSGNGTLRQAIQFNESIGGGNTIVFLNTVTGSITLTNPLGELLISKDVIIIGPGAKALTISGNNAHRVFHLSENAVVNLSGLTIASGNVSDGINGGGGILQQSGTLTLSDCILSENYCNTFGGGISASGTVMVSRCTFSRNLCQFAGGAIHTTGTFTAINSTFSGNYVGGGGGGILQTSGSLLLTNCTISGNYSIGFYPANSVGGGIQINGGIGFVRNSIIASNTTRLAGPDCYGAFVSGGFNLIGAINGSTGWGALGDQVGTTNNYLNPLLGPLQGNGGSTLTMAPSPGSPAIDQGNGSGITTDQRGRSRPHTNDYIGSAPLGGDRNDIGAVELNPSTLVVSNANDNGTGSLRQTIASASPVDSDIISFASNVVGTIVLTTGELVIGKSLTIQGPTVAPVIVSGNNASRVFRVTSHSTVNISSLTISNGNTGAQGAGFYNESGCTLSLNNCAVVANVSGNNGGGVANNGFLAAYNCTFASNRATFTGGGIYTYAGPVVLRHCTVVSNTVISSHGGGLCNYSLVAGTSNYITGTLVAGNSALGHHDVIGVFTSGGYNLIGQIDYSTPGSGAAAGVPTSGLTNGINHDKVGSIGAPIDPKIGRLQHNGGPTPTMALLSNSPAIDKGISKGLSTDQRGAPRPFDFATRANDGGDGSDIGAFELGSPTLNIQKLTTSAVLFWPYYYGDFTLQSVANGIASSGWINVVGTPAVVADQYVLTNSPIFSNQFFRLNGN